MVPVLFGLVIFTKVANYLIPYDEFLEKQKFIPNILSKGKQIFKDKYSIKEDKISKWSNTILSTQILDSIYNETDCFAGKTVMIDPNYSSNCSFQLQSTDEELTDYTKSSLEKIGMIPYEVKSYSENIYKNPLDIMSIFAKKPVDARPRIRSKEENIPNIVRTLYNFRKENLGPIYNRFGTFLWTNMSGNGYSSTNLIPFSEIEINLGPYFFTLSDS